MDCSVRRSQPDAPISYSARIARSSSARFADAGLSAVASRRSCSVSTQSVGSPRPSHALQPEQVHGGQRGASGSTFCGGAGGAARQSGGAGYDGGNRGQGGRTVTDALARGNARV